jgi:hypothetical protein
VYASSKIPKTYHATWSLYAEKYDSTCAESTLVRQINLTLNVVDTEPPSFVSLASWGKTTLEDASLDSADAIDVRLKDNYKVDSARLEIRYLNTPVDRVDTTVRCLWKRDSTGTSIRVFGANVGSNFTVKKGYEYRIHAWDAASSPNDTFFGWYRRDVQFGAKVIPRPADSAYGAVKLDGKWYMLGVPGLLDTKTPEAVLGEHAATGTGLPTSGYLTDWRLYPAYQGDTVPSVIGPADKDVFTPGNAVWFRHRPKGTAVLILRLPSGFVSPNKGGSVEAFNIQLDPDGWTMFSNPFFFDVYLPVEADGRPAPTAALLRGDSTGYWNDSPTKITKDNPHHMEYLRDPDSGKVYAVLHPWVGYAIRSNGLEKLSLDPRPSSDPKRWPPYTPAVSQGSGVTIEMSSGSARLGEVLCGFAQTAKNDWDPADWPLFPVPQSAGTFYVAHDDWGKLSDRYVVDVRAAASGGATYQLGWRTSQSGGEMRLTVSALDDLPIGATAVLYDRAMDKRIELSAGTSYTFRSELSRDDNRFVVLIGDAGFADQWTRQEQSARPVTYQLAPNYPNPFNAGTVIGFTLPQYTHVSLEVFNILGQRVRTLVDHPMYPGVHQIEFDGTDNAGRGLAAGVYFYRLKTELGTRTHKMVLLK